MLILTQVQYIPNNLWFFVIPESNESIVSDKLSLSAITIEVKAKLTMPKDTVTQNEFKISNEYYTNFLLDGYETYYLNESDWKKIDRIELYFQQYGSFKIDNRVFRQMERFASTFLMFGGDKHEAIDTILYNKLLKVISHLEFNQTSETDDQVLNLFEQLFGLEYLPRSKQVLKDIQTNIEQVKTD